MRPGDPHKGGGSPGASLSLDIPNFRSRSAQLIRRTLVIAGVVTAGLVAANERFQIHFFLAVSRARIAATSPDVLTVRLATRRKATRLLARVLPSLNRRSERLAVAARLSRLSRAVAGDDSARLAGIANVLAERCDQAVYSFDAVRNRDADDWNDLAAASLCAAIHDAKPDHWLAALAAVDEALAKQPDLLEARFNRAAITHGIGILPVSGKAWKQYLAADSISPWAGVARRRLAEIRPSEDASWRLATENRGALSTTELTRLTNLYPHAARRYVDVYLTAWAAASVQGNPVEERDKLRVTRVIALALQRRGEPLFADAVAAIESADALKRRSIAAGEVAYLEGRIHLRDGKPTAAESRFRDATRLLAKGGSPTALLSEFWTACALGEQQRGEAIALYDSLLSRLNAARPRYQALAGHLFYQLALEQAARGHWSMSLSSAERAAALFTTLGEQGSVARAKAILCETYDLLGQPHLAWAHGLAAVRGSAADGALDRTRVALAALCRTELRGGRWSRARALAKLEMELAPDAGDVRMEPDMFLRAAVADWRAGERRHAGRWMRLARTSALSVRDAALRQKLLADVNAAEGALERSRNARRAIRLLSAAITYQQSAKRPIVLPELYLERGRANDALKNLDLALADYDAGIAELERQRSHVMDAELRPGIFDDASALFDSAIALQLSRGVAVERIWSYVQRGRGRAVREQIGAHENVPEFAIVPAIGDVQRALPDATALLEYVSLPERLLAFVITKNRLVVRTIPISRSDVSSMAEAFVASKGARGGRLADTIIAPVRDDLMSVAAINLILDPVLDRVPFTALVDPLTHTFLIERYSFALSPSASVFLVTVARANRDRVLPLSHILIMANPRPPDEEFGDLPALVMAEAEARQIARSYAHARTFERETATAERFRTLAPLHQVVYFAGHAVTREREPWASALVCAATPELRGALTAREIARMHFKRTRVVVLAACSTMVGRKAAIEGMPSLARAFLVAGVPAVIGTGWDIEDHEAAVVMRVLHQELARGTPPADALRSAQVRAIRSGHPIAHWAAFSAMGSTGGPGRIPP
jgi:tetratricopeptide (TPR) repeat protein